MLLADPEVFPQMLMPQYVRWYTLFARNRIVLAYTGGSRGAAAIDGENWRTVITRPGVEVGRSDPNTDPSGYRALLTMQLAEQYYREPGLSRGSSPPHLSAMSARARPTRSRSCRRANSTTSGPTRTSPRTTASSS